MVVGLGFGFGADGVAVVGSLAGGWVGVGVGRVVVVVGGF